MKIAVLDGETRGAGTALDRAIEGLMTQAAARGDACLRLPLSHLDIHQCVGCFDCWIKTPGICRLQDDGSRLAAASAWCDLMVFASPMRMGFTNALLKRATDRLIPAMLPYIRVVGAECHHTLRYDRGFDLALLLERGDASDEEIRVTEGVYRRLAKNVDGELAWVRLAGDDQEGGHAMDAR
jgi:multimeric flavodoxin WrbA